jgi:molybdate-binding protein
MLIAAARHGVRCVSRSRSTGARALVEQGEVEYEVLRDEWSRGG